TQAALLKAGADAEVRGWALSQAKNLEYMDLLKKNGMTIVAPPAQLTSDMKKVGDTMLKEWLEKAGPEGQAIIDSYKKM
ncbi:MAG TPA: C4-dicarboxylate ABC transporter substrate-binding protein, partial [Caldimonas sp.]